MKSLILLLCLLFAVPDVYAAVAHVQSTGVTAGGSVASVNHTINSVVSGNTLVAGGICDQGFCPSSAGNGGFTDDKSNTWVWVVVSNTQNRCDLAYANNVATGNTQVTFTPTSNDFIGFGIAEFSGVKNSSPGDGSAADFDNGTTVGPSGPVTTGNGVVIGCVDVQAATSITPGATWIQIFENEAWTVISGSVIYKLTSAGTNSPSWTLGTTADGYSASMGLLEEPAAAGRPRRSPMVFE